MHRLFPQSKRNPFTFPIFFNSLNKSSNFLYLTSPPSSPSTETPRLMFSSTSSLSMHRPFFSQDMSLASQALDLYDVFDFKFIAGYIKKEFDNEYGNGWQFVVGSKFGCFFTHSKGIFIYFTAEKLKFFIFKGDASSSTSL